MADTTAGLGAPEKTIVINSPNKTLDKLSGKEPVDPASKDQDPKDQPNPEPSGEDKKDQPEGPIRSIPTDDDKKDQAGANTSDAGSGDAGNSGGDDEDETVDLTQLSVEIGGQERSVSDLLTERDELAKRVAEIDGDPFIKGLIDHYKTHGNIDAYYEAKGVDWDKKDSLDVLRAQFDRDNADIDPKIREKLWKREIAAKYSIKDDLTQEELESDDYRIAQELLKRDANKVRESFKENQKKYQAPERKAEEPAQKFDPSAYREQVLKDPSVQTFVKNKLLPLGVKDGAGQSLGFEPKNPDQIIEMMVNDRNFWSVFIDPKTKAIDRTKLAKVYAYAQDPDFVEQSLVNLGKNLHLEERLKEDKQIDDRLTRKTPGAAPKDSFAKGFLSAALKQKKN